MNGATPGAVVLDELDDELDDDELDDELDDDELDDDELVDVELDDGLGDVAVVGGDAGVTAAVELVVTTGEVVIGVVTTTIAGEVLIVTDGRVEPSLGVAALVVGVDVGVVVGVVVVSSVVGVVTSPGRRSISVVVGRGTVGSAGASVSSPLGASRTSPPITSAVSVPPPTIAARRRRMLPARASTASWLAFTFTAPPDRLANRSRSSSSKSFMIDPRVGRERDGRR